MTEPRYYNRNFAFCCSCNRPPRRFLFAWNKNKSMYHYSKRSKERLASCDARLQCVFNTVIQYFDCTILDGHRSKAQQNHYFKQGKSQVQWPDSKHNCSPSLAVDVVPYPIDWLDTERMAHFAGFVLGIAAEKGVTLRWGGDWDRDGDIKDHRFLDYPHFELID